MGGTARADSQDARDAGARADRITRVDGGDVKVAEGVRGQPERIQDRAVGVATGVNGNRCPSRRAEASNRIGAETTHEQIILRGSPRGSRTDEAEAESARRKNLFWNARKSEVVG